MDLSKEEKQKKLIEIRESMGINRKQFAEYFGIPYRTVQDWELRHREITKYLLDLIAYKVEMDKKIQGNDKELCELHE